MIPVPLASVAVKAAWSAYQFGVRVDRLNARKLLLEGPIALPVADPALIVDFTIDELVDELHSFVTEVQGHPGMAALVADAEELIDTGSTEDVTSFLKLHRPLIFVSNEDDWILEESLQDATREELEGVLILKSSRDEPITGQIVLLATELITSVASGFLPNLIGDAGVRQLVQKVLENFAEQNADTGEVEDVSMVLARRALNATLDAVATHTGEFRGRNDFLDLGFDLLKEIRDNGLRPDEDWFEFATGFFDKGGMVRLMGALVAVGGAHLAKNADREAMKGFVTTLTEDLAEVMRTADGRLGEFLSDNWPELVGAGLEAFAEHTEGLLDGREDWVRLGVKTSAETLGELLEEGVTDPGELARNVIAGLSSAFIANPDVLADEISEEGFRKLLLAALQPLSDADNLRDPNLFAELAAGLAGGILDLAANDGELLDQIFSNDEIAGWLSELAGQFRALADNQVLEGLFDEDQRKELGKSLVTAALRTLGAQKSELGDAVPQPWLRALVESLAEAAGSETFESLVGAGGVRNFVLTAADLAAKHPSLISTLGSSAQAVLPVVVTAIRENLGDGSIENGDLATIILEGLGAWLNARGDVRDLELEPLVSTLTAALAEFARSGEGLDRSLLPEIVTSTVRVLTERADLNFLIRPSAIGDVLNLLFDQSGLTGSSLVHGVALVAGQFLRDASLEELTQIAGLSSDEWLRKLGESLERAIEFTKDGADELPDSIGPEFLARLDAGLLDHLSTTKLLAA